MVLPPPVAGSAGDAGHVFEINSTLTGAMLLVFHVWEGSTLAAGFAATYGPATAGALCQLSRPRNRLCEAVASGNLRHISWRSCCKCDCG